MKGVTFPSVIVAAIIAAGLTWLTGLAFHLEDAGNLLQGPWDTVLIAAFVAFMWAWFGPAIISYSAVWTGVALLAIVLMLLRQAGALHMSDHVMGILSIIAAACTAVYTGNRWLGKQSSTDRLPGSNERVSGDYHGP